MAATAAAVAAAVVAASATAYSAYSSSQASKKAAAIAGRPRQGQRIPLPPYAQALNTYSSRLIAENANKVAPSFGEWVKSGGEATFPMTDVGFTPKEMAGLKMVDPRTGGPVPFGAAGQRQLTPEQILYLGQQKFDKGGGGPMSRYYWVNKRLDTLAGKDQTADVTAKEERLGTRKSRLEDILGIGGKP